jgi:hypothetical protein
MQGQMAAASSSNPLALVDIYSAATGAQARNTCLAMKLARQREERPTAPEAPAEAPTGADAATIARYNAEDSR